MRFHTIESLVETMTLEEKIAQLVSASPRDLVDEEIRFSVVKAAKLLKDGIGHISAISGTLNISPEQAIAITNAIQNYLIEHTRLKIPAIVHEECLSGFCAKYATIFPQAIGQASTWEPDLIRQMTDVIRLQMRAVGVHQALAPVLDVIRDLRWGRCEETFGEDAYLVATMGAAYIEGLQGDDLAQGIAATAKHFAAHALSEGGRNCAPVHLGMRELRDIFLYPFEVAVKQSGIKSVMNAYHDIDGVPCASSRALLTGILRDEWGFQGPVVSDYFAIERLISHHHTADNKLEAACQALEAGIDVELPEAYCYTELFEAVQAGKVELATLNQAVLRVLKLKQEMGLFENALVSGDEVIGLYDRPAYRELSYRIAQKSMVLLKNDGGLLPFKKDLKSIAVIGPNAASCVNMLGDYSYNVTYSVIENIVLDDRVEKIAEYGGVRITTVLEGIQNVASQNTEIHYAYGCDLNSDSTDGLQEAVELARGAEVAVVVVGDQTGMASYATTGEDVDRVDATLTGIQDELVRQIVETGTPVVVVLLNGRPVILENVLRAGAILEAWRPGEAGGQAIADVLFGDVNPGGKLPLSMPGVLGQTPLTYNLKPVSYKNYIDAEMKAVFPFGHGLGYTSFAYSDLQVLPGVVTNEDSISIRCEIKNCGDCTGEEVVQLYLHDVKASITRPVKELKGFFRVFLKPGEIAKDYLSGAVGSTRLL